MISLFTVTAIYILVNISYFAVLSVPEILDSQAVAMTFADLAMGRFAPIMPIFVAVSCAGGLNSIIFAASRMFFVGARLYEYQILKNFLHYEKISYFESIFSSLETVMKWMSYNETFRILTNFSTCWRRHLAYFIGK